MVNIDSWSFEPLPSIDCIPAHGEKHGTSVNEACPVHGQQGQIFTLVRWETERWRNHAPPDTRNRIDRFRIFPKMPGAWAETASIEN